MKKIIFFMLLASITTISASKNHNDWDNDDDWGLVTTPIVPNIYGFLPLQQAVMHQDFKAIQECIARGDDINQITEHCPVPALSLAISKTDNTSNCNEKVGLNIFMYIVKNVQTNLSLADHNENYPAHYAVEANVPTDVMKALIRYKAELNKMNNRGITPRDKAHFKANDFTIHPTHRKHFYEISNILAKENAVASLKLEPKPSDTEFERQYAPFKEILIQADPYNRK